MKVTIVLTALFTVLPLLASAQGIDDLTLDSRFECQVKSLAEFLNRFNGVESYPGVMADEKSRRNNMAALMDFQMSESLKKNALEFIQALEQYPYELHDTDSLLFADTECDILVDGKEQKVHIVLQKQEEKGKLRWSFVGVRGIEKFGIIDFTKVRGISPVDNEINFMEMIDAFKYHSSDIFAYRSSQSSIDQLSVFLTLARMKHVELLSINKLTYHVLSIPNYVFTIDEISRENDNSGWLISSFKELPDVKKNKYVQTLLGK